MSFFDDWFGSDEGTGTTAQSTPIIPKAPPWAVNYQPATNTSAPGQVQQLANNLAAGGFGTAPDLKKWMDTFYRPSPMMQYASPVAPTAAPRVVPKVTTPVAPVVAPRSATLPNPGGRPLYGTGQWLNDGTQIMSSRPMGGNAR